MAAISQEEMDALLGVLSQEAAGSQKEGEDASGVSPASQPGLEPRERKVKIKPYDFRRPDRFSNEQMRTLQMLHENFGRLFAASLSTHLRTVVEIKVLSANQITFEEFLKSVPNPTNVNIFSMSPLQGTAILEMNPVLVFTLIDRILGGPGNPPLKQRDFTDIEMTILEKVVKRALDNLKEAWQHAASLNFKLEAMESNPLFVQIVSPDETVALINLEVKIKSVTSTMNVCIPYVVLETIISKLSAHQWFTVVKKAESGISAEDLKKNLKTTFVRVSVQLGVTHITIRDLLSLKVGDVVRLDNGINEDLKIYVGDRHTFSGRPGLIRKRKGVQIVSILKQQEEGLDG